MNLFGVRLVSILNNISVWWHLGAISFSVISVLSGCMTLYGFGLNTGGPAVMLWGWVLVGAMVTHGTGSCGARRAASRASRRAN
ncbi:hypothetical protein ACFWA4_35205 [Streptomyces sp. NPDC060011]|uniref:hypothetical protein n=1 Tax=Streptomyces sp. NPDC060011 TaxID=3347037 RepID=UPI0036CEF7C2